MVVLLDNPVRSYAWGSPSVLPELLGEEVTGDPQAELWVGAHPGSPSTIAGSEETLDTYIAAHPDAALGADVIARTGPKLPFLLKILAIERPLSIQVHPTKEQAEEGYAAENAAGIPLDAPQRNYRDANHKPEMVVALTDFSAFVGFREPAESAKLLREFADAELNDAAEILSRLGGLEALVRSWLTMPGSDAKRLADLIGDTDQVRDVAEQYPGDRGLLLAFLLNRVTLRPGEAVFVGPGVPHAYVSGVAVEPQASSDNTLRAGLTSKHVDVPEVLRLLRYEADGGVVVEPHAVAEGVRSYDVPGLDEFHLRRVDSSAGDVAVGTGSALVLAVEGVADISATGSHVRAEQGQGAFVSATDDHAYVNTSGAAFVVTVGWATPN